MEQEAAALAQAVGDALSEADYRVMNLLGIQLEAITPHSATCTMTVRDDMVNSHQYCHGGLIFTLADHAFAYACCASNLTGVTLSANILYAQPAHLKDQLTAVAQVINQSGRSGHCEVTVTNQNQALIARYQGVWYRLQQKIVERGEIERREERSEQ